MTGGVGRDFYLCSTKPGPAGSPPLPTEVRAIDGLVGAIKLLVVAPEGVAVDPFGFGELNVSLQPFGGVFAHGGLQEGRQELRHGFEFPLSVQSELFRDAGQHRPGNTETLSTGRGASTILSANPLLPPVGPPNQSGEKLTFWIVRPPQSRVRALMKAARASLSASSYLPSKIQRTHAIASSSLGAPMT